MNYPLRRPQDINSHALVDSYMIWSEFPYCHGPVVKDREISSVVWHRNLRLIRSTIVVPLYSWIWYSLCYASQKNILCPQLKLRYFRWIISDFWFVSHWKGKKDILWFSRHVSKVFSVLQILILWYIYELTRLSLIIMRSSKVLLKGEITSAHEHVRHRTLDAYQQWYNVGTVS